MLPRDLYSCVHAFLIEHGLSFFWCAFVVVFAVGSGLSCLKKVILFRGRCS